MPWMRKRRATAPLDITASLPNVASGQLLIWRDGNTVWLHFVNLKFTITSRQDLVMSNVIPPGLQPSGNFELPLAPRTRDAADEVQGNARIYGHTLVLYRVPANGIARGLVSFPTGDVMPS